MISLSRSRVIRGMVKVSGEGMSALSSRHAGSGHHGQVMCSDECKDEAEFNLRDVCLSAICAEMLEEEGLTRRRVEDWQCRDRGKLRLRRREGLTGNLPGFRSIDPM